MGDSHRIRQGINFWGGVLSFEFCLWLFGKYISCGIYLPRQVLTNLVGNSIKFTRRGFIHLEVELQSQTPIATAAAAAGGGGRKGDVARAEEVLGLVTKSTQVAVGFNETTPAAANSREMTLAFRVVDSVGFARLPAACHAKHNVLFLLQIHHLLSSISNVTNVFNVSSQSALLCICRAWALVRIRRPSCFPSFTRRMRPR